MVSRLPDVKRNIPLFFLFDRYDSSRWTPVHYSDCLLLKEVFPDLYKWFMDGDFTIKFSQHKSSAAPVDQVLGKEYNKNATVKGSVTVLRKKELVARWNNTEFHKI